MKNWIIALAAAFSLTSCLSEDDRFDRQIREIEAFAASTGLEFTPTGTGLYYHIEVEGNQNRIPDSLNHVSFKHTG